MDYRYIVHRIAIRRQQIALLALIALAVFSVGKIQGTPQTTKLASEATPAQAVAQEQTFTVSDETVLSVASPQPANPVELPAATEEQASQPATSEPTEVAPDQAADEDPSTGADPVQTQPEPETDSGPEEPVDEEPARHLSIGITDDGCYVTAVAPTDMLLEIHSFNERKGSISEHAMIAGETLYVLSSNDGLAGMTIDAKIIDSDGTVHAQATSTTTLSSCQDSSPYTP